MDFKMPHVPQKHKFHTKIATIEKIIKIIKPQFYAIIDHLMNKYTLLWEINMAQILLERLF